MNNYLKQYKDDIKELRKRENILVHVCCGVCSMYPLHELNKHFNISILYTNSNIYPESEFDLRLSEFKKYLDHLGNPYKLIIPSYNHEDYMKDLREYADLEEGQIRCKICYYKRLEDTAKFAKENGYDCFTTVMSISNRKKANWINEIGDELAKKYQIKFIHNDFKKDDGININQKMNEEFVIYHQPYCGCEYSMRHLEK